MRIILCVLASIGFCRPLMAADVRVNPQLWGEVDVTGAVATDWSVTGQFVDRLGEGLPDPTLWGGGAVLDHRIGDWTLSAGDLNVVARLPVSGARLNVNVPLAAVTYGGQVAGFEVSDRSRFEDLVGVPGDPWRYRNRLAIERPIAGTLPLRGLFASEEIFFSLQTDRWERSRAEAGAVIGVTRRTNLRVFYVRQDDRSALPQAINGVGLTLTLTLN